MEKIARTVLIFGLLALTACGFSPVYGSHGDKGPVVEEMNAVAVNNIPDRQGQMLRNDLIDRMYGKGRPSQPRYELSITMHHSIEDLGILANATATRALLNMYADYTLADMSGKALVTGEAHSVASFNKLDNQFGTLSAEEGAFARTINEVNEQIVNRLSLYFAEGGKPEVIKTTSPVANPAGNSVTQPAPSSAR